MRGKEPFSSSGNRSYKNRENDRERHGNFYLDTTWAFEKVDGGRLTIVLLLERSQMPMPFLRTTGLNLLINHELFEKTGLLISGVASCFVPIFAAQRFSIS